MSSRMIRVGFWWELDPRIETWMRSGRIGKARSQGPSRNLIPFRKRLSLVFFSQNVSHKIQYSVLVILRAAEEDCLTSFSETSYLSILTSNLILLLRLHPHFSSLACVSGTQYRSRSAVRASRLVETRHVPKREEV